MRVLSSLLLFILCEASLYSQNAFTFQFSPVINQIRLPESDHERFNYYRPDLLHYREDFAAIKLGAGYRYHLRSVLFSAEVQAVPQRISLRQNYSSSNGEIQGQFRDELRHLTGIAYLGAGYKLLQKDTNKYFLVHCSFGYQLSRMFAYSNVHDFHNGGQGYLDVHTNSGFDEPVTGGWSYSLGLRGHLPLRRNGRSIELGLSWHANNTYTPRYDSYRRVNNSGSYISVAPRVQHLSIDLVMELRQPGKRP